MSLHDDFHDASERLQSVPAPVALIARGIPLDSAIATLESLRYDQEQYGNTIRNALEKLALVSDGPIKWEHGRGRSGISTVPARVFPHRWSSAHEAAFDLQRMALEFFYWPVVGPPNPDAPPYLPGRERYTAKQQSQFKKLLSKRRRQALAMSNEEVADLQERIRRERAKFLGQFQPSGTAEMKPKTRTPDLTKLMPGDIQQIVEDAAQSVDEKLRKLSRANSAFYELNSVKLGEFLGCSDSNIRQTNWWKEDRRAWQGKQREDYEPPPSNKL